MTSSYDRVKKWRELHRTTVAVKQKRNDSETQYGSEVIVEPVTDSLFYSKSPNDSVTLDVCDLSPKSRAKCWSNDADADGDVGDDDAHDGDNGDDDGNGDVDDDANGDGDDDANSCQPTSSGDDDTSLENGSD